MVSELIDTGYTLVYPVFGWKGEFFMKFQWTWLLGILFAIIIAVFSVLNVDSVPVNYAFGTSEWPLVLVILCSALLGAAISGIVAMFRFVMANHRIKELLREMNAKELTIAAQQNQIMELQKLVPADDPFENEKES